MMKPEVSFTFNGILLIKEVWALPNRIFSVSRIRKLIEKKYELILSIDERKSLGRRISICLFWMVDTRQDIRVFSETEHGVYLFQKLVN